MSAANDLVDVAADLLQRARAGEPLPRALLVDPGALGTDAARGAFWVNLYNALVLDLTRALGSDTKRVPASAFRADRIAIGAAPACSLHIIEHGLLRANRPAPWTLWRPLGAGDPRLPWALTRLDPRVHFALNCGARSCPPIRAWTADGWDQQLELATRSYFASECGLDPDGAVRIPWLLKLYSRDFPDPRGFSARHAPDDARRALDAGVRTRWGTYDWSLTQPG